MDPELILTAPPRLLAAGIADALARAWETDLAVQVAIPGLHAKLSHAVTLGYAESVLKLGIEALTACDESRLSEAFVQVTSACNLGAGLASGLCGAFYRLNVAHSVAYGLTHLVEAEESLHGEAVGVGLLVQWMLQDPSGAKAGALRARLHEWGLPVRFSDAGWDPNAKKGPVPLARLVGRFLDREHAIPFPVTETMLCKAIEQVEETGEG